MKITHYRKNIVRTEYCEWCGEKVSNIDFNNRIPRDDRFVVFTTLGSFKVCGECHTHLNAYDKLPRKGKC